MIRKAQTIVHIIYSVFIILNSSLGRLWSGDDDKCHKNNTSSVLGINLIKLAYKNKYIAIEYSFFVETKSMRCADFEVSAQLETSEFCNLTSKAV